MKAGKSFLSEQSCNKCLEWATAFRAEGQHAWEIKSSAYQQGKCNSACSVLSRVKAAWLTGIPRDRQDRSQSISAVVMLFPNGAADELMALKQEVGRGEHFMQTTKHKGEGSVSATNRLCWVSN